MNRFGLQVSIVLAGIVASAACGSSASRSGFDDGDGGDNTEGGPGPFGGDSADGRKLACSGDLRSVVDESGVVVLECPPDKGCAAGGCIAACDAAAASRGSIGCDYAVATPTFQPALLPPCFAIFVANNWPKPVAITVERDGKTYDVTSFGRIPENGKPESAWAPVPKAGLPEGQVAVLFISSDPASSHPIGGPLTCPVPPALAQSTAVTGTGRGKAWHIRTSFPVTAYDILPYGGAKSYLPSAELLFPTSAWGKNYVAALPPRGSAAPQWGQIVALEANTEVTVLPNVTLPAGAANDPPAFPAKMPGKLTLGAFEYVQWQESNEMTGTVIQANKPVAFTGGQGYQCYKSATSTGGGCDSGHQMIPPVQALGSTYAVAPYATRRKNGQAESVPYRIVGIVDGTTLTFDPTIAGAPAKVDAGQFVDFESTTGFVVTTQDDAHPIAVGESMTGCSVEPGATLGDEDYVNVLAPAQFLSKYVFFTDPTYGTTSLTFVRKKTAAGFQDVTLACLGTITGWKPVGTKGEYELANADIIREKVKNGSCDNGGHVAASKGPFGLTVWGLDYYASYGYPAGGNIAPINAVVVPAVPK